MKSSDKTEVLRQFIRESILSERRFYRYRRPSGAGDPLPQGGPQLVGRENPQSLDQVGLVHSLVTPAYRTLFGGGVDAQGNPIEGGGLFGVVTGLAGTVVSLLSGVFSSIGNLAGTVSGSISGDISSNNPRRYNRNISGGGRGPIRENTAEASDFLSRVSRDVDQVVSDYLVIKSQPDIQSLNNTLTDIFLDYTSSPPIIPDADSLLSDAISVSSDPTLQNLSERPAELGVS